ncbi:hypothetical protein D3C72_2578380 [compost metagenome]
MRQPGTSGKTTGVDKGIYPGDSTTQQKEYGTKYTTAATLPAPKYGWGYISVSADGTIKSDSGYY